MKTYKTVTDLIGKTPLIKIGRVYAKLEYFNPAGSIKDRVAREMIFDAEKRGLLKKGATIVEPTSGNTGIGLAMIAAARGYKAVFTMPETMSAERIALLKAYGAEVVLTDGAAGMRGAVEKAEELAKAIPDAFIPGQFTNPANPRAHYKTTGPEIWKATGGKVDILVACVGTGGTVTGTGGYLKSKNPDIKVVAVEPAARPHKIQGIGANFVPEILDLSLIDETVKVTDGDAFATAKALAHKGVLVGTSSGAALWAAERIAEKPENAGKVIVAIFPDSGERYLSLSEK